mmetsp:Transcript_966/g.3060  ORF Transcript_966/g.3060 Transcript_966/m.3060 type:complete len:102 (+) Transcript_966:1752-2057(+)
MQRNRHVDRAASDGEVRHLRQGRGAACKVVPDFVPASNPDAQVLETFLEKQSLRQSQQWLDITSASESKARNDHCEREPASAANDFLPMQGCGGWSQFQSW